MIESNLYYSLFDADYIAEYEQRCVSVCTGLNGTTVKP